MIAMNSKTYVLRKDNGDLKVSSKGLNHRALQNPLEDYHHVLSTRTTAGGYNTGFILRDNFIKTYRQYRNAISYLYVKRCVMADGIATEPLTMKLCPRPLHIQHDVVSKGHELDPTCLQQITFRQKCYPSLAHVLQIAMTLDDPEAEVYQLLKTMSVTYRSLEGHNIVVARYPRSAVTNTELTKYYSKSISYWTSGLQPEPSADWSSDIFPGKNKLGAMYMRLFQSQS